MKHYFCILIIISILIVIYGAYGSTPDLELSVVDRTPAVRDAIVKAIKDAGEFNISSAVDVTAAHLASITVLNLSNQNISELKAGDFSGLTGLVNLNLYRNKLSGLPVGVFEGLTALTTVRLGRNSVDPLPFTVSLLEVSEDKFKAVIPAGALFDIVLPITVASGSLTDNVTTVTVLRGHVESGIFSVTRTPGTTKAVTVTIGTLPSLPSRNHYGYKLVRSESLPLTVISSIDSAEDDSPVPPDDSPIPLDPPPPNTAPRFLEGNRTARVVPENIPAGMNIGSPVTATDAESDPLTYTLIGPDAESFSIDATTGQLRSKVPLDYETRRVYFVTLTVADKVLSDTIVVIISVIDVNDTPIHIRFVPVLDRTPAVRDAIVSAVPNVATAADVTEAQVATLTSLNLRNKGITSLEGGDFSGMVSLRSLNLYGNQLRRMPMGIFSGLTSLTTLRLGGNAIYPVPLVVMLEQVGNGEFRAVMTSGAPFPVVVPIRVTDGSIRGGRTTVTIPQGSLWSPPFNVDGTSAKVSFGTLPKLPRNHFGYTLSKSDRTPQVTKAILKAIGVTDPSEMTHIDIATITDLNLGSMDIKSLKSDDFAGMISLQTLTLSDNKLKTLPSGIFSDLTALANLYLDGNKLETLPNAIFDGPLFLWTLSLDGNELKYLSGGLFDGIPNIRRLYLSNNKLTALPADIFKGLTQLNQLYLNGNTVDPLLMPVSLHKVGENQLIARIPVGAPWSLTLPIIVKNGKIMQGSVNAFAIPIGEVESQPLTIVRMPGTRDAVTAVLVSLPKSPAAHKGYTLVQSEASPLQVFAPLNAPPDFTEGAVTTRSIAENTEAGADIGVPVSAKDPDPDDTLTYTLSGDDAASFSIDATTGQLKTEAALDYENKKSYAVTISVSDGKLTDMIKVTINTTDVNEPPVIASDTETTLSVAENTEAGADIGVPVSAKDPDPDDTLTYTLSGDDAASFSIDATTGQLKTEAALDYENKKSYAVTISVSDGKLTDMIKVTINTTDVNEPPVIASDTETTLSVAENTEAGADIGVPVSAKDPDPDDTLTYTLSGDDAASFSIDATTGQLKTEAALDYENKKSYAVTISVSDGKLTDTIKVTINIDEDENQAPIFTLGDSATRSVAENTLSGQPIGGVFLTIDAEEDILTYTLSGDDAASFSIDATTGQLKTKAALDYENKKSYAVTISVSDGELTDTIKVTINVTDIDETDRDETDRDDFVLKERIPEVKDAIVSKLKELDVLEDANTAEDVTAEHLTLIKDLRIDLESSDLTVGVFEGLTSLTSLDLSGNFILDLPVGVFEGLTSLTSLDLSDNWLGDGTLPVGVFEGLTSLTSLNLSDNILETLPVGIFEGLTSLTLLDLSDNFFETRPTAVEGLTATVIIEEAGSPQHALNAVAISTKLYTNYPNPFNPETWIPYQLSKPSLVTLTIYNTRGQLVRQLDLGLKPEGIYISRSRAAHWDGRNNIGEKVVSGIYFYRFTAGDFIATRKMLILK